MSIKECLLQLKRYWRQLVVVLLFSGMASFFISLVQTPQYSSESRLLLISYNTDILKSFEASQALGNLLVEILYSYNFFQQVISQDSRLDQSYFAFKDKKQLKKKWEKMIKVETTPSVGILELRIFHPSSAQAYILNQSIDNVLIKQSRDFYPHIRIKVLDPPLVSQRPTQPRVLVNVLVGALLGLILFLCIVYGKKLTQRQ